MEKIDLAFRNFSLPDNASRLIQDCRESADEICSRAGGPGCIPLFEPADGRISWNLLNSVVQQLFPERKPVFCEWGSGVGLVTLLASIIGMPATGIEIEEELIDQSREFSRQYALPASFYHASIYPDDNPMPSVNYEDIDLFFAYPWPNEIAQMTGLFKQVASDDAVLVCYHGGQNYRVLSRNIRNR